MATTSDAGLAAGADIPAAVRAPFQPISAAVAGDSTLSKALALGSYFLSGTLAYGNRLFC